MTTPKSTLVLILAAFFSLGMGSTPPKPPPADTTPPQVSITAPANNSTVSGSVNIQATATDNVGVTKVEFYVDNSLKSTSTNLPYTYSWNTAAAANASHTLKVVAYDAKNNSNLAQINVTVNNTTLPPPPPPPPPADGSELTISSAAASSSNKSYPAFRAIDKNLSTYWQGNWSFFSRPSSWWLTFDLSKPCSLTKISIFWHNTYGSTNYNIQGSTNGTTWVNLYTGLSSAGSKANPYQKDYSLSGSYRYLRIYINKSQNTYPIIYEVKLYGSVPVNKPPQINSLLPADKSVFITGDTINISVSATDPESDALQYRYTLDDLLLKDWSVSSSYGFVTNIQNRGRHDLKVEVKDADGAVSSGSAAIYIFRKFPKPTG